jgi:hypothetical protein
MKKLPVRNRMLSAIHVKWAQKRPDIRSDKAELAGALRDFAAQVCELANVESLADLSDKELGFVLDALNGKPVAGGRYAQPTPTAGANVLRGTFGHKAPRSPIVDREPAEITHLASPGQVVTAEKLFNFVQWPLEKQEAFLERRYKTKAVSMLTFKRANGLVRILLNIAASRDIKRKMAGVKVSQAMIKAAIPELKRRLGIR